MSKQKGRVLFFFCLGVFLSLIDCSLLWAGKPDWQLPLEGGYSYRITVQYGGLAYDGTTDEYHTDDHNGYYALDFDNPSNNAEPKILATADGVVIKVMLAKPDGNGGYSKVGYGFGVVIDHGDGYKTTYGHFKELPLVKEGDKVYRGQIIGIMGNTGASSGSHLHFAVTYNGLCKKDILESKPEPISGYCGNDLAVNKFVTAYEASSITRFTFPNHSSQGWSAGNNTYAVPANEQDSTKANSWKVRVAGPNPGVVSPNLAKSFFAKDLKVELNVKVEGITNPGFIRLFVQDEHGLWDNMVILGIVDPANNGKFTGYSANLEALGSIMVNRISLEITDQSNGGSDISWSLSLVNLIPRNSFWNFTNNSLGWTTQNASTSGYPGGDNWEIDPTGNNPGIINANLSSPNIVFNESYFKVRFSVKLKDCSGSVVGNENNQACLDSPAHLAYLKLIGQNSENLTSKLYAHFVGNADTAWAGISLKEDSTGSNRLIADGLAHTYTVKIPINWYDSQTIDKVRFVPMCTNLVSTEEDKSLEKMDTIAINWIALISETADLYKPNNLRNGVEAGNILNLSWEKPFEIPTGKTLTGYRVYLKDNNGAVIEQKNTASPQYSFSLSYGQTFYFNVAAIYSDGSIGPQSNTMGRVIPANYTGTPTPITDLVAYPASPDTINLHWQDTQADYQYSRYRIQSNGIVIDEVSDTSFSDGNLTANTQYCYRVTKISGSKVSAISSEVCTTTLVSNRLATPSGLHVWLNPEDQIYYLTWTAVDGADSYIAYCDGTPNAVTTNRWALTGLQAEKNYLFSVKAKSVQLGDSEKSYTLAFTLTAYIRLEAESGSNYRFGRFVGWNDNLIYAGMPGIKFTYYGGLYSYNGAVLSFDTKGQSKQNIFAPSNRKTMGDFGTHFSFSPNRQRMAISSPGACGTSSPYCADTGMICIYNLDTTTNTWQKEVCLSDNCSDDSYFGKKTIWLSEGRLAISAPKDSDTGIYGVVYIYKDNGSGFWAQESKIYPDRVSGRTGFGNSLVYLADSNTLLIGADKEVGTSGQSQAGAVYIFQESNGAWTKKEKLRSDNQQAQDFYGQALIADNTQLFIGVPGNNDKGSKTGAVFYHTYNGSNWVFQKKIYAKSPITESYFGNSLSMSGNNLAIGASGSGAGSRSYAGVVYVFNRNSGYWVEQKLLSSYDYGVWRFGSSVALKDNLLLVGADSTDGVDLSKENSMGVVFLYDLSKL